MKSRLNFRIGVIARAWDDEARRTPTAFDRLEVDLREDGATLGDGVGVAGDLRIGMHRAAVSSSIAVTKYLSSGRIVPVVIACDGEPRDLRAKIGVGDSKRKIRRTGEVREDDVIGERVSCHSAAQTVAVKRPVECADGATCAEIDDVPAENVVVAIADQGSLDEVGIDRADARRWRADDIARNSDIGGIIVEIGDRRQLAPGRGGGAGRDL